MSEILVTGGAGFIGSNLVDHFVEAGREVVCLDNLATEFEKNIDHMWILRRVLDCPQSGIIKILSIKKGWIKCFHLITQIF